MPGLENIVKDQYTIGVTDPGAMMGLAHTYVERGCGLVSAFPFRRRAVIIVTATGMDVAALRAGMPYEQVPFITPVYEANGTRMLLMDGVVAGFKRERQSEAKLKRLAKENGLTVADRRMYFTLFRVPEADGDRTLQAAEALRKHPLVKYADPDWLRMVPQDGLGH
jgi:hypothetical protein